MTNLPTTDNICIQYFFSQSITEEQLIVLLQDLFLAGSETTGTAMTWALLFIALNPRVKNTLRDEVNRLFPNKNEPISIADLKKYFSIQD